MNICFQQWVYKLHNYTAIVGSGLGDLLIQQHLGDVIALAIFPITLFLLLLAIAGFTGISSSFLLQFSTTTRPTSTLVHIHIQRQFLLTQLHSHCWIRIKRSANPSTTPAALQHQNFNFPNSRSLLISCTF
jgi:hypothetical protein